MDCIRIQMVREKVSSVKVTTATPGGVFRWWKAMDELALTDREMFVVLMLDTRHHVIGYNVVSMGSVKTSVVHPREVFKAAILANASTIILIHNHPSGDPHPSPQDREVTRVIAKAGKVLDIPVLDHVIIGDDTHYSLHDHGLL